MSEGLTETPRVDVIALRLTGKRGLFCDPLSLEQYNDLLHLARQLERELATQQAWRQFGEDACKRYNDWYMNGASHEAGDMAYDLVSTIRAMLAALQEKT